MKIEGFVENSGDYRLLTLCQGGFNVPRMDDQKSWVGPFFLLAGILGYLSQLKYGGFPMTAFEWPSIDMGPFFERVADPTFLQDDFVVNSMNEANPRWVFGYQVLGLMKLFGLDWHQAYLLLKSFIVVLVPGFMFLFFVEAAKTLINKDKLNGFTLFLGILCIALIFFSRSLQMRINIGWYYQSELKATPHSLASLYGFIGSVLLFRGRWYSYPFLMASTFTHPAVGFLFCCFNVIFQVKQWRRINLVLLVTLTVLVPFATLLLLFASNNPLPTDQLIEIYIKNRLPHHYDVNSWEIAGLIRHMAYFVLYFTFMMFAFWSDRKKAVRSLVLAVTAYVGAIFSQYFFIHVIPLRPVVLLGPVRLTAFSFVICAPYLLALVEDRWGLRGLGWSGFNKRPWVTGLVALFLSLTVFGLSETNPLRRLEEKSPQLYDWVKSKTEPTDVFVGPLDVLADEFVLIARRPVFISQIFPFSEELYPEYHRRWQLIYGPVKSERHQYFENQSLEGWSEILGQEKIDYIILPKDSKSPLLQLDVAYDTPDWVVISRQAIAEKQGSEEEAPESP